MKQQLKRIGLVTCLSVINLLLVACGPQKIPTGLVYCSEGNPESFNPQTVTSGTTIDATSQQLYDTLVDYDPVTSSIVPALAISWQGSDDGLTYRFKLRSGVQFHHTDYFTPTRDFNADDVLFSFNRIIDTENPYHSVSANGYPFFQSIGLSQTIKQIEKVAEDEIVFHLNVSDASFLSNLATGFSVILSKEYADTLLAQHNPEQLDSSPIGTGPFKLTKYVKNEYIRYHRNEQFWRKLPEFEHLVFDITPKSTARLTKLITGDCNVSALPKAGELPVIKQHDHLELDTQLGFNVAFWAFNTQKVPFNDVRVRKALAYAVDKQNILRAVYQETAIEATGMLPPQSWAYRYNRSHYDYNPQKAKALLKEAGIEKLNIDVWAMPVARIYNPNTLKTAELIQADLANIGVSVNIVTYDWSVFNQKLNRRDYDSVLIGWNADNSDPDNFFSPILSCDAQSSSSNRAQWCNPEMDAILAKAKATTIKSDRKKLYQQAEKLFNEQLPMLPFAHATKLTFKQKNIKQTQLTPFGGISFENTMKIAPEDMH
ncbi:ABC transporter substrate-binding protein [Shewanella sp. Choline-02u-19]|jgi:cationic peptide transport system substrate-binding protein|uniref:ABC transporter substrate-binding protein n=1 Tax=unclassified Shewanella TaxID=196818 RepID=UPI000C3364CD|nr:MULTISPECIES: ABC transporter substrate-binding protein [unclassified Shewanella]PKG58260.1 ABC transporter substrate-binding protein [Shewanella sp. GutDb-MelDb]PKG73511.1 ABC transporter substrate-binding protein [Shewanella sp. GutCb]PKH53680.1 ABC transporter substrate-binding protein [Shewanella sp. Bg11-22]PKI28108.1 ABC transporter substrate-binding protein [Shewanella sp. Choline-02u-19]